jgi:MtN3 and saliva related transmembrane protein
LRSGRARYLEAARSAWQACSGVPPRERPIENPMPQPVGGIHVHHGRSSSLRSAITLCSCEGLAVRDTSSLLVPRFQRSEVLGFVAGFGTTFAAVPDLLAMLKRRSSKGTNPTMAGIMGIFQIVWVYYGLLIGSRPVIALNMVAVVVNFLTVAAYFRFAGREPEASSSVRASVHRRSRVPILTRFGGHTV